MRWEEGEEGMGRKGLRPGRWEGGQPGQEARLPLAHCASKPGEEAGLPMTHTSCHGLPVPRAPCHPLPKPHPPSEPLPTLGHILLQFFHVPLELCSPVLEPCNHLNRGGVTMLPWFKRGCCYSEARWRKKVLSFGKFHEGGMSGFEV